MLTDAFTLRTEFRLPPSNELPDDAVDAVITEASIYIQRAVSNSSTNYYTDAVTDWTDDPSDIEDQTRDFQRAEKYYAVYLIIMRFGVRFRRDGFVKKEQDTASPATTVEVTNEYWTQKEIEQRAIWYRDMALGILDDYAIVSIAQTMGTLQIA